MAENGENGHHMGDRMSIATCKNRYIVQSMRAMGLNVSAKCF